MASRSAISLPRSYVRVLCSRTGRCRSFFVKPARALVASVPYLGQNDQASRPLHQVADGRTIAGALDQVALPVARHGAGGHLGGTLRDRRHSGNLAAAVYSSRLRPTRFACLPQCGQQFTAQGAPGQSIERGSHKMVATESCVRMSSGSARRRHPAICSGEPPAANWVRTWRHSHGSRSVRGCRG